MKRIAITAFCLVFVLAMTGFAFAGKYDGKKVLFIDSYHEGYAWSDGITNGVKKTLEGSGVELKIHRMDTKRNNSDEQIKQAAEAAKAVIEEFKPDVVIASDDNASKHVIAVFYKDSALPFVFCGVNWDASGYGFPTKNITGMVEVTPMDGLLTELKKVAKGDRIGILSPDNETERKEAANIKKTFGLEMTEVYVKDADAWMNSFKELQGKVDILLLGSDGGLWADTKDKRIEFVLQNTAVPTGSSYDFMAPYAMITYAKVADEQGEWAANAALKILDGASPDTISIAKNEKGQLIVNAKIVEKLGVDIPYEVLESAKILE